MSETGDELRPLREGIDRVDTELVRLFAERMELARRVGEYKRQRDLPITDPQREKQVIQKRTEQADPRLAGPVTELFETLMRLSREEQHRIQLAAGVQPGGPAADAPAPIIAYQGVPGAFGHQAALQYGGEGAATLPCGTFKAVLQAVSAGQAALGVLPLENSSSGSIDDVCDLLGEYGCAIVGEVFTPVAHCLLGLPGAQLSRVESVYSHEQGFLQCRAFLAEHPGWRQVPHFNTAVSAQYVAEQRDPRNAAIASRLAAQCYGLNVLAEDIHTQAGNTTRFVAVAAHPQPGAQADKATLTFVLRHERGTLHRALAAFVALGMNLTRIESRPIPGQSWEYRFFVDIEGRLSPEKLHFLIEALEADCVECRVLGHYPAARRVPHEP